MATKSSVVSNPRQWRVASQVPVRASSFQRWPPPKRPGLPCVEEREREGSDVRARAEYGDGKRVMETAESRHALKDPAHIWARMSSEISVRDFGGDVSLDQYMRLPVEQYYVLDSELIKFVGGNRFELHVPKINLMNVWLDAVAVIVVQQGSNPPSVNLKTESCRIQGSDVVDSLQLDKRFSLQFEATLTWRNGGRPALTRLNSSNQHNGALARGPLAGGGIFGDTRVDVWCEVVPPFSFMPREILEGSCNLGLQALTQALLPLFLSKLRDDYRMWGRDEAYRKYRSGSKWKVSSR